MPDGAVFFIHVIHIRQHLIIGIWQRPITIFEYYVAAPYKAIKNSATDFSNFFEDVRLLKKYAVGAAA